MEKRGEAEAVETKPESEPLPKVGLRAESKRLSLPSRRMRGAHLKAHAWQRFCRRGQRW